MLQLTENMLINILFKNKTKQIKKGYLRSVLREDANVCIAALGVSFVEKCWT